MHIGLLAAAAHAAATNSRFTIFYNPRASPCEFVIPLVKYAKAVYHTRVSVGMCFGMLFETEESSVRRYMGTITGIGDLDPVRWPNSHWRSVKVGWDESTAGERQPRVSLWEIEPLTTFLMYPSLFPLRLKRPWASVLPSLPGGKDDSMGLGSQLMWLNGDRTMQSMNFQGLGMTPWMQPRIDASMLSLQTDMYPTMAAAALQEMRAADAEKQVGPGMLQFQSPENMNNRAAPLLTNQLLQHLPPQSQHAILQSIQESQGQNNSQAQFLQQLLQYGYSFGDQQQLQQQQQMQQQLQQQQQQQNLQQQQQQNLQQQQQQQNLQQQQQQQNLQQQQQQNLQQQQQQNLQQQQQQLQQRHPNQEIKQQLPNHQQTPHTAAQSQSSPLHAITSFSQPNIHDTNGSQVTTAVLSPLHSILGSYSPEESSNMLSLPRSNPIMSSGAWPSKRLAVESMVSSGTQGVPSQVQQLCSLQNNLSQQSVALPPFPGRVSHLEQEGGTDPQSRLLFGVNIDSSSLLVQNGMPSLRSVGSETDATTMPFAAENFMSDTGTELPLNQPLLSSSCLEESGFLHSPDNVSQVNSQNGTFVKVYKSGSFGRSLDITKFNSYPELRTELGRLFGLEGQLEDPVRSGWQLVFVDQENDVLLVGDDPWQEFVNNVWCIKILSLHEVQHLGKGGIELTPAKRLSSSSSNDDFVSRQEIRSFSTGLASPLGALDY